MVCAPALTLLIANFTLLAGACLCMRRTLNKKEEPHAAF